MKRAQTTPDPMTQVLATFRRQEATDWGSAWVGMEPTFQSRKSVRKWIKCTSKPGMEDRFFSSPYMLRTQKRIAVWIKKQYEAMRKAGGRACCMFTRVELGSDLDQWGVPRRNLCFHFDDDALEPFEVRFVLDPETFEYSIKPVPLAWFYDERFVDFLEEFIWGVPLAAGLTPSIAHGGAQFSFSAKTFLTGSLLADDIATRLNHPELATWIMDFPNMDARCFRATRKRFRAFREILEHYWAGGFHPQAIGVLTAENAYLDRGFGPAPHPPKDLMTDRGPRGNGWEQFQTNFAFGRAVRLHAQNVHPGYWQGAHPDEDGYRPDQIMRYSEGNLNRLQIAGEYHVKSGKTLDKQDVPELDAPLEFKLLTEECSWENRAQMGRSSARDYVEALLLDVHHAQYLQQHPRVAVQSSLLQDQLHCDAEETIRRNGGGKTLDRLHAEARKLNLEASRGQIKSDWIEPETLFWEAWKSLPAGERAAIAREAIAGLVERVEQAASVDPRPERRDEPMEWHRHRIHPELWRALEETDAGHAASDPVCREWEAWKVNRDTYLARRPIFSPGEVKPPWD